MATTKKGWRQIIVDGATYRWQVGKQEYYYQSDFDNLTINVIVERVGSGALLRVTTLPSPRNPLFLTPERIITPKDVEGFVRQAMSLGWISESKSKPFAMQESK